MPEDVGKQASLSTGFTRKANKPKKAFKHTREEPLRVAGGQSKSNFHKPKDGFPKDVVV